MTFTTFCVPVWTAAILLATSDPAAAQAIQSPLFESDVLPILNNHCLQCHGGVHQRKGLDLRTHATVMKGSESGPVIIPGKPDDSLIWKKVHADVMPKTDNKLSAAEKSALRAWIEAGAKGAEVKIEQAVTRPPLSPAELARRIDQEIDRKLSASKLPASPRADDAEFLRRACLDLTGRPPAAADAASFLTDASPDQRANLIDRLLASPDFGKHYAEQWVNLFLLPTVNQRPPDPKPFVEWLAGQMNQGRPWDQVVRGVLTAEGPVADAPQGLFFYYNSDMNGQFSPKILSGNIGQVFLGVQLQCAECHDHPFSNWKQTDFWAMAAYFGQMQRLEKVENKMTPGVEERHLRPPKPGKKEQPPLKEIAISIPKDGEARNGGMKVRAGVPGGVPLPADPTVSHRLPFADWLTSKNNRMFARPAVNRLWANLFACGFVNPLNDFGDHNAPSHPELLELLAEEFIASDFDVKHVVRSMCLSDAYQRTSRPIAGNESAEAGRLFARMTPKVLTPEQLYDALCTALEVPDLIPPLAPGEKPKKPNPKLPPPPSDRETFIQFFRGPGEVDEPGELKIGVPHALRLMNQMNFNTGGKLAARVAGGSADTGSAVDELFLAILCRKPASAEREPFVAFVNRQKSPVDGYSRVAWVLINSSEFMLNH